MITASHTRRIAEFAAGLKLEDIPQPVIARAKDLILDGLGCGLYGIDLEWTEILARTVRRLEPGGGQATVWGRGETASAVNAALINGTLVQGYEMDDAHIGGALHSCAVVLPAALAAAEYAGAGKVSGGRLLAAIIAGFEIGPRAGMCMRGERMSMNGWHSGAIIGPFPAAIAAGIVLGLDSNQLFHALGIAGTQSGGLMAAQYGSMVKRMQHAKGSQSGLYGALLAAEGFTGIEDVFEQPYGGFCATFSRGSGEFDLPALSAGLGERWETLRFTVKTYACKAQNHAPVNAISELMAEGLTADQVEAITIAATEAVVRQCGWHPYVPKGLTGAQHHAGFCVAMQLIEGDVFVDQMVVKNAARPDLVALANRVRLVRSVEREQKGNEYRHGADVEVVLKDGRVLRRTVDHPAGSHQRPLSSEQVVRKFRRLASKSLPQQRVDEVEGVVRNLENLPAAALTRVLHGSG
ncbi:MAG: MmgE/PrpD family protein [Burkholderiales bacterium]|nr:MmgE/PrpD family protein [Burkholderiales bacterium]